MKHTLNNVNILLPTVLNIICLNILSSLTEGTITIINLKFLQPYAISKIE